MLLAAAAAGPADAPAWAATTAVRSQYTVIELKTCRQIRTFPDGGAWECTGLPGYPIYVAESGHRTFVSAGPAAGRRRAAIQSLGAANSIFQSPAGRATLEWRFERRMSKDIPYAAILRFFTEREGTKGQVIVVIKVSDTEACQIARIDALATADPILLARAVADERAKGFDCKQPPEAVGAPGKSPM